MEKGLEEYVDVARRIADFRVVHPGGCLQPADPACPYEIVRIPAPWCVQCIGRRQAKDKTSCQRCGGCGLRDAAEPQEDVFIVYTAAAYRTPDDSRPGIGIAWEPYPGRTPFTSASELMNAETSAWGRAIVAVLASDSKSGIASREEIRNRREDGLPANRDGSLSRSRTSDEEKAAAGNMTSAQWREHTRLQERGPVPGAERGPVPAAEDPWDVPPETRAGSRTPEQQAALHAAFTRIGVTDRNERLEIVASVTGTAVSSSTELSYVQAAALLAWLRAKAAKAVT